MTYLDSLDDSPILISIIIPVWQEETINETIDSLIELARFDAQERKIKLEIIIIDGDPAGSTIQRLWPKQPTLAEDDTIAIRTAQAPQGRGQQLNAGARLAQGEILLFLHADARLPAGALSTIAATLANRTIAAGAFDLAIDSPRWILKLIARVASWRSRLTRIPYGDQAIFIRRETFWAIGGYPQQPLMEDVALMQALKRRRLGLQIQGDRVTVSARRWQREGWLYCTLRNWLLVSLYGLGVPPDRLVRWY